MWIGNMRRIILAVRSVLPEKVGSEELETEGAREEAMEGNN
jgi:hypothetical protein